MNLLETLRELKKIQPDTIFSENSRRAVLAFTPAEPFSPRHVFARSLAAAGSLVLAGALIFIITGGLSATNLTPQFSSIDPTALRAEAQAIDTEINLLNINYAVSTAPISIPVKAKGQIVVDGASLGVASTTASSTPAAPVSVDEVLQGLSK